MFTNGFVKTAEYDYADHAADLLSTHHQHVAKKDPQGYMAPVAVMASLGGLLGAAATRTPAGGFAGGFAGAAIGAAVTKSHNDEVQEAKKVSYMGSSERKAYYRGRIAGMST